MNPPEQLTTMKDINSPHGSRDSEVIRPPSEMSEKSPHKNKMASSDRLHAVIESPKSDKSEVINPPTQMSARNEDPDQHS